MIGTPQSLYDGFHHTLCTKEGTPVEFQCAARVLDQFGVNLTILFSLIPRMSDRQQLTAEVASTTQTTDMSDAGESGIFNVPRTHEGNKTDTLQSSILKSVKTMRNWVHGYENDTLQHAMDTEDLGEVYTNRKGASGIHDFITSDPSKNEPEPANINILIWLRLPHGTEAPSDAGLTHIATAQLASATARDKITEAKDEPVAVTSFDGGRTFTKDWDWTFSDPPAYDEAGLDNPIEVTGWIRVQVQVCPDVGLPVVTDDLGNATPSDEVSTPLLKAMPGERF